MNFFDVAMPAKKSIVAVGPRGVLKVSNDLAERWNNVKLPILCGECARGRYTHVAMATSSTGFVTLATGEVLKTADGGASWSVVTTISGEPTALAFANERVGAVAAGNEVWFTHDGGSSWNSVHASANDNDNVSALSWAGPATLLAGGANGFLSRSSYSGPFTPVSGLTNVTLLSVAMLPSGIGIAVSETGKIVRTETGGTVWKSRIPFIDGVRLTDVAFATDDIVCATSETNMILRSKDQGVTWRQSSTPPLADVTSIAFARGSSLGISAGRAGVMTRSRDNGASWSYIFTGTVANFIDVAASVVDDREYVVAATEGGKIFVSTDGGDRWSIEETGMKISAVNCDDPSSWIAVGEGIVRSIDRGVTWYRVDVPHQFSANAVSMNEEGFGVAVGKHGLYAQTVDHGISWTIGSAPYENDFNDVVMTRTTEWYAVGSQSLITKHIQGKLAFDRDTTRFADIPRGETQHKKLRIHNTGSDDVMLSSVVMADGNDFVVSSFDLLPIEPGKFSECDIMFQPRASGEAHDLVRFENDAIGGMQSVHVIGGKRGIGRVAAKTESRFQFTVNPNPATSEILIRFMLGAPQPIRLDLLDQLGRSVMTIEDGYHAGGEYVHRAVLEDLPAGVYLLRLTHRLGVEMKRVMYMPIQ